MIMANQIKARLGIIIGAVLLLALIGTLFWLA